MAKAKPRPRSRSKVSKTATKKTASIQVKQTALIPKNHDNSRSLAISGFVGLILTYFVVDRALNTGSYWEYILSVLLLVITIRIFIRSIRLK